MNDAIRDRFQKFRACHGARVRLGRRMRSWAIFARRMAWPQMITASDEAPAF
jgi:hypothetical protein